MVFAVPPSIFRHNCITSPDNSVVLAIVAVDHLRGRRAHQGTTALIVNVLHLRLAQQGGWGFFVVEHNAGGSAPPAVEIYLYQEMRKALA